MNIKSLLICLLIFAVLATAVFHYDRLYHDGLYTRDFFTLFIHKGTSGELAVKLLGTDCVETGSGMAILEYDLPLGHHFYVSYMGEPIVYQARYDETHNPWVSYQIPIILSAIALLECVVFFIIVQIKKRRK